MARFQKTLDFLRSSYSGEPHGSVSKELRKRSVFLPEGFSERGGIISENPVLLPSRGFNELETPPPVQASVPTGDT
jgi:hypothetical protein